MLSESSICLSHHPPCVFICEIRPAILTLHLARGRQAKTITINQMDGNTDALVHRQKLKHQPSLSCALGLITATSIPERHGRGPLL
jgi:hypothetical protein